MTIHRVSDVDEFFAVGEETAVRVAGVEPGSVVVLVAGLPIGVSRGTNLLRVLSIPPASEAE
jgi:pyruvate kinase